MVYLDFSKAFDKVPIRRLLLKCSGLGIQGKLLAWIENWLVGRKQRVVLNGEASPWGDICSGVVQGSCLGPTLFILFINDIDGAVDTLSSVMSKFADDTKWGKVVEDEKDKEEFQRGLDSLKQLVNDWQMEFNVDKWHIMHIRPNKKEFSYKMGGQDLQSTDFEKDIGVIVISRVGVSYRDKDTFLRLFRTYARQHLDYCAPAWSP